MPTSYEGELKNSLTAEENLPILTEKHPSKCLKNQELNHQPSSKKTRPFLNAALLNPLDCQNLIN